ncbi:MAG: hypothetical protein LLG15_03100 [Betaproteobacteria bacterium]|nr:hypothetical protein [Betaproteobacteria bacterium]
MAWFEKEMDYARESLEQVSRTAIEEAAVKLDDVVREGIVQASDELREVVSGASREVDAKLDKISAELHSQRQFTKDDVKELVDYAADRLGATIDNRVRVMKTEITGLVQDRVEYLKHEVDSFFIQRQQDLARERRRLIANILIAVTASVVMGGLSLMYHRAMLGGGLDMYGLFRVVFLSLTGGYGVYLLVKLVLKYRSMAEHKKDLVFLAMKYWGVLRPESVFGHVLLILILLVFYAVLFFPQEIAHWIGNETLIRWVSVLRGIK